MCNWSVYQIKIMARNSDKERLECYSQLVNPIERKFKSNIISLLCSMFIMMII